MDLSLGINISTEKQILTRVRVWTPESARNKFQPPLPHLLAIVSPSVKCDHQSTVSKMVIIGEVNGITHLEKKESGIK